MDRTQRRGSCLLIVLVVGVAFAAFGFGQGPVAKILEKCTLRMLSLQESTTTLSWEARGQLMCELTRCADSLYVTVDDQQKVVMQSLNTSAYRLEAGYLFQSVSCSCKTFLYNNLTYDLPQKGLKNNFTLVATMSEEKNRLYLYHTGEGSDFTSGTVVGTYYVDGERGLAKGCLSLTKPPAESLWDASPTTIPQSLIYTLLIIAVILMNMVLT